MRLPCPVMAFMWFVRFPLLKNTLLQNEHCLCFSDVCLRNWHSKLNTWLQMVQILAMRFHICINHQLRNDHHRIVLTVVRRETKDQGIQSDLFWMLVNRIIWAIYKTTKSSPECLHTAWISKGHLISSNWFVEQDQWGVNHLLTTKHMQKSNMF